MFILCIITTFDIACVSNDRLWKILRMPMMKKLDLVIKYTSRDMSSRLEGALDAWEAGAAALLRREEMVNNLQSAIALMGDGNNNRNAQIEVDRAKKGMHAMTVYVLKAEMKLKEEFGDFLTLDGEPYVETYIGSEADKYASMLSAM